ncbi:MAG: hypothetical protein IKE24_13300, partial [Clostridia bacterium]|nr:hypothetical protein [Clostridia bacterium]
MDLRNRNDHHLNQEAEQRGAQATAKAAARGGMLFGKKAREARLREVVDPSQILSSRVYNAMI